MLNLKELSKKLDAALESETEESLTNWLLSQRAVEIEGYTGLGEYISCENSVKEILKISNEEVAICLNSPNLFDEICNVPNTYSQAA